MRTDTLYVGVMLALLWVAGLTDAAVAQVPDNREPRLDPDDRVAPAYRVTLDERDSQRLDAAREAGDSFMPLFQGPGADAGTATLDHASGPARPEPAYEGYRRPEAPASAAPARGGHAAGELRPEGIGAEGLIGVLIESWTRPPEIVRLRYRGTPRYPVAAARAPGAVEDRDTRAGDTRAGDTRAGDTRAGDVSREADPAPRTTASILPHIAAGRGIYARTLYAVHSDHPGPVLLELLEPPLAGAVAAGQFSLVGERLALRLDRLEYRGRSVPVDAWAVDLDCACYGVEGEVESHWLSRVLLPAAARFAEGFLAVLSRPAESVSIGGDEVRYERREAPARDAVHAGLATAARTAGDVLLESAPDGPTVRLPRDTELVVVFAASPGRSGEPGDE